MLRVSVNPLVLMLPLFVLLAGCSRDHRTVSAPAPSPLTTVSTALGAADVLEFHADDVRQDLAVLVSFESLAARGVDPLEFHFGGASLAGLAGEGFSARVIGAGSVGSVAMSVTHPNPEAPQLEFAWNQGEQEYRTRLRIDADSGELHRDLFRDGKPIANAMGDRTFARLARPVPGDHREELLALLGSVEFRTWLVRAAGTAAGRSEADIESLSRWTDDPGWRSVCDWAGLGTLATGWCIWNPVCAGVFVPSISISVACGLVTIFETVGDWFGWWGD